MLCVDDEPQVLESLHDSLRRRFEVVTTTNGFEALRILACEPCQVVLSDMRMPMLNGARFLTLAREHAPDTVRLLLTGHSAVDSAIAAVNEGEIFRFLLKPCPTRQLVEALETAVARHWKLVQERRSAEETLEGTVRAFARMAKAIDPGAPARAKRVAGQAAELVAAAGPVALAAVLPRACELMQVGTIGLSPQARVNLASGRRLRREHAKELERLPELAARFLGRIPSLGPEVHLLAGAADPFVPTRHGVAGTPPASRVLRIAVDFDVLETQGVSSAVAVEALSTRTGRYDERLLERFAELPGVSEST